MGGVHFCWGLFLIEGRGSVGGVSFCWGLFSLRVGGVWVGSVSAGAYSH